MECLTVGISTRALFDLEQEHKLFLKNGADAYIDYQINHEHDILSPGPAFGLVRSLLNLNKPGEDPVCEIIIISQCSTDCSLRIFNSIEAYGLGIKRAALTTGESIVPYLSAFGVDLYLSADESDVREAISAGIAAGMLLCHNGGYETNISQIRIAFDGDCVLFSDEAQQVFDSHGLAAFNESEKAKATSPLNPGPLAHFLETIATIQSLYPAGKSPIRTALVTARCAPSHERVVRTLRAWNVRIDDAFFLGGLDKSAVLSAFGAHIFFDDSEENTISASAVVLSARVPRTDYRLTMHNGNFTFDKPKSA